MGATFKTWGTGNYHRIISSSRNYNDESQKKLTQGVVTCNLTSKTYWSLFLKNFSCCSKSTLSREKIRLRATSKDKNDPGKLGEREAYAKSFRLTLFTRRKFYGFLTFSGGIEMGRCVKKINDKGWKTTYEVIEEIDPFIHTIPSTQFLKITWECFWCVMISKTHSFPCDFKEMCLMIWYIYHIIYTIFTKTFNEIFYKTKT